LNWLALQARRVVGERAPRAGSVDQVRARLGPKDHREPATMSTAKKHDCDRGDSKQEVLKRFSGPMTQKRTVMPNGSAISNQSRELVLL
jgi:hypothetical protein